MSSAAKIAAGLTKAQRVRESLRRRYGYHTPIAVADDMRAPCAECGKEGYWDSETDCCPTCSRILQETPDAQ